MAGKPLDHSSFLSFSSKLLNTWEQLETLLIHMNLCSSLTTDSMTMEWKYLKWKIYFLTMATTGEASEKFYLFLDSASLVVHGCVVLGNYSLFVVFMMASQTSGINIFLDDLPTHKMYCREDLVHQWPDASKMTVSFRP